MILDSYLGPSNSKILGHHFHVRLIAWLAPASECCFGILVLIMGTWCLKVSFNESRWEYLYNTPFPLHWRHNDHDGVWNHQPHGCLLNRLLRRRSKKTSKLRVTGLCVGNSPGPVNSPHKGPVTRKMFPFDDVIMRNCCHSYQKIVASIYLDSYLPAIAGTYSHTSMRKVNFDFVLVICFFSFIANR